MAKDPSPRYVVTWAIDIEDTASTPVEAATQAMLALVDGDPELYDRLTGNPDAPVVFDVADAHGTTVRVDLAEDC